MAERDIAQTDYSDLSGAITDYSVEAQTTDAHSESKETEWTNSEWTQQLGYYKKVPELKAAIDAKATWTVGKGYQADPTTELILGGINGNGSDTVNTILENMIRTYNIGGDAFAEVMTNDEGYLINLKPLTLKL